MASYTYNNAIAGPSNIDPSLTLASPFPALAQPFTTPQINDGTRPFHSAFQPPYNAPQPQPPVDPRQMEWERQQQQRRREAEFEKVKEMFPGFEGTGKKMGLLRMYYPEAEKSVKRRKVVALEAHYKPINVTSAHSAYSLPPSSASTLGVSPEFNPRRVSKWASQADALDLCSSGKGKGRWFSDGGRLEAMMDDQGRSPEIKPADFFVDAQGQLQPMDVDEIDTDMNGDAGKGDKENSHREGMGMNMNVLARWEEDVVWNESIILRNAPPHSANDGELGLERYTKVNEQLEGGAWEEQVIWGESEAANEVWRDNDPVPDPRPSRTRDNGFVPVRIGDPLDPLVLSQDQFYQRTGGGEVKHKKRQTVVEITDIQHARPALKMQVPHYPISLTKHQARYWHRPRLTFPLNTAITFSEATKKNTKQEKAARRAGKPVHQVLKTTADVTLTDRGKFCLVEFAEQYPPIMSGFGMGSNLVNYYRQRNQNEDDENVEKMELGETAILAEAEDEPIPLIKTVPGETQQVLVNNLIRVPLWKHTPSTTDFLVIRQTINGKVKYVIRDIPYLFVAGQVLPHKKPVPNLKSKELSAYKRERFIYIVNRLLHKQRGLLAQTQLTKWYPDDPKTELNTKTKEFLCRSQLCQPLYTLRLKSDATNQNYKAYSDAIQGVEPSPESAMLYEAHHAARRLQEDAGIVVEGKSAKESKQDNVAVAGEGDDPSGDTPSNMDAEGLEKALASWNLTRNYLTNFSQLALDGYGSPFTNGRGFNLMLRGGQETDKRKGKKSDRSGRSNKDADFSWLMQKGWFNDFTASDGDNRYETDPTAQYPLEVPPTPADAVDDDDDDNEDDDDDDDSDDEDEADDSGVNNYSQYYETIGGPEDGPDDDKYVGEVLKITRVDENKNVTTEIVKNPKVIKAYLNAKLREEVDMVDLDDNQAVNRYMRSSEKSKEFKRLLIGRLKKLTEKKMANLTRRQQTKKLKDPSTKKQRIPTCSTCGQQGHTKRQLALCPGNPNAQDRMMDSSLLLPKIKVKLKQGAKPT